MIVEAMYDREGRPAGVVCHVAVERDYLEDVAYGLGLSGSAAAAAVDEAIEAMPAILGNIDGLGGISSISATESLAVS